MPQIKITDIYGRDHDLLFPERNRLACSDEKYFGAAYVFMYDENGKVGAPIFLCQSEFNKLLALK